MFGISEQVQLALVGLAALVVKDWIDRRRAREVRASSFRDACAVTEAVTREVQAVAKDVADSKADPEWTPLHVPPKPE